jgi:beta-1,4-N-acetylglucosaminyltransferase
MTGANRASATRARTSESKSAYGQRSSARFSLGIISGRSADVLTEKALVRIPERLFMPHSVPCPNPMDVNRPNCDQSRSGLALFATVGSTSFDELVRVLTRGTTLSRLGELGFSLVTIQYGRGAPIDEETTHNVSIASSNRQGEVCNRKLMVRAFRYSPSLSAEISRANVVLCHGGSGSVFEAATACPGRVVVVPNRTLMDDHQTELASELQALGLVHVADVNQPLSIVCEIAAALREGRNNESNVAVPTVTDVAPRNRTVIGAVLAHELAYSGSDASFALNTGRNIVSRNSGT